jgi:membrane protein implicated in regulation of membrane protease activity
MTPAVVLLVALVAEDPAVLRNAPRDDAPAQASLWRGDWLEVRGESAGFLKVYDHRHERPGYVRPWQVRTYHVDAETAPELRAVVRFLRDAVGYESLGIGTAALALKAAPAGADTSELLAAIGSMADRLGRRASARRADSKDATLAAHVAVAESYGVKFEVIDATEPGGRGRVCYNGEAWAAVLAAPAAVPAERARAALFLSVDPCRDPAQPPAEARLWNDRRLRALESIDFAAAGALPAALGGRVRLRHAEALAWRAFDEARQAHADAASRAEAAAVRELALCDRGVLAPEDLDLYDATTIRVAASRWATETVPKETSGNSRSRKAAVSFAAGQPGETCVRVTDGAGGKVRLLGERCTFGVVWPSALRWAPSGDLATLAVQPLAAWTELWVLRRAADGTWGFETLTPATADPDVGYVESAGFSPDGRRLLLVREARAAGRLARRFQVLDAASLGVEKWASSADKLLAFRRWSAPSWRSGTLALR